MIDDTKNITSEIPYGRRPYRGDLMNRSEFAKSLRSFMMTEHNFMEGGLVISLNASYGSGKTTFLKMWCHALRKQNRYYPETTPCVVTINAWESDYCSEPIIPIISSLCKVLKDRSNEENNKDFVDKLEATARKICHNAKTVGKFTVRAMHDAVRQHSGIDILEAARFAKKQDPITIENDNLYDVFKTRQNAIKEIKKQLNAHFGCYSGQPPNLLIVIDELDRCRPDYAISYLEAIKHIFDIHGIIFILAVDYKQLESTAKVMFGPELIFSEYYRKFAHRQVYLPAASESVSKKIISRYVKEYILGSNKELRYHGDAKFTSSKIESLIAGFHLTPRQLQEIFRAIAFVIANTSNNKTKRHPHWCHDAGCILMCVLYIAKYEIFERIGVGQIKFEAIHSLLSTIIREKITLNWWLKIIITGGDWRYVYENYDELNSVLSKYDLVPNRYEASAHRMHYEGLFNGWGNRPQFTNLKNIYDHIMGLRRLSVG